MGYSADQAKAFINHIAPIIQNESKARGYKSCASVIAQAIIEGACGTSGLAKNYHNHFGLKAGNAWLKAGKPSVNMKTKEEYTVGSLVTINDYFRAYKDDTEGVKGYYDFINTSRYANLINANDYMTYAQYLKSDGYATSSNYVNTLCSTVSKYNLTQYDNAGNVVASAVMPILRKGAKGPYVSMLQGLLIVKGFPLKQDGIFGSNTEQAVIAFQGMALLQKDGVVGKNTWKALNE